MVKEAFYMQHDFTKLRQALQDPADGPYSLIKMRELLIHALHAWPAGKYQVVDFLLPHGTSINQRSRRVIEGLLASIGSSPFDTEVNILMRAEMCELLMS